MKLWLCSILYGTTVWISSTLLGTISETLALSCWNYNMLVMIWLYYMFSKGKGNEGVSLKKKIRQHCCYIVYLQLTLSLILKPWPSPALACIVFSTPIWIHINLSSSHHLTCPRSTAWVDKDYSLQLHQININNREKWWKRWCSLRIYSGRRTACTRLR